MLVYPGQNMQVAEGQGCVPTRWMFNASRKYERRETAQRDNTGHQNQMIVT
jgi:hypothetical protein